MYGLSYSTNRDGLSFEIATFACRWKADEVAHQYAREFAARYSNHNARVFDISQTHAGQIQDGAGVRFACDGDCGCKPGVQARWTTFEIDDGLIDPEMALPSFFDGAHVHGSDCE